jgi:two-component system sensor histidine kinase BaeS
MRLGAKLILAFLVVGLTGVALIALIAGFATETEFMRFVFDEYQGALVSQLEEYYHTHAGWKGVEGIFPFRGGMPMGRPRSFNGPGGIITLTDDQGFVIVAGHGYRVGEMVALEEVETWQPIERDGQVVGWVVTARDQFGESPAEVSFLNRMKRTLTIGAIGAVAVSLLLAVLLARTLAHPLRELTTATRAVAEGNLDYRVPVRSKDELGELATSFNLMSAELSRSQTLRRQMTADIAHELRTPISVILGHVDGVDEGVLPASSETFNIIREETGRLERLIEDLRTLSRADAGELTLVTRLVQLKTLLEQVIAAHRPLAHEKRISLRLEVEPNLQEVIVDPDRIAQVLSNLITNALRYSPEKGQITLSAKNEVDEVEIRVQDSGPGLQPDELTRIFDRFYRTDQSRQRESGGSGLGLAIAKSLVEMHAGRLWAESEPGKGTHLVVRLPVSDPDY